MAPDFYMVQAVIFCVQSPADQHSLWILRADLRNCLQQKLAILKPEYYEFKFKLYINDRSASLTG